MTQSRPSTSPRFISAKSRKLEGQVKCGASDRSDLAAARPPDDSPAKNQSKESGVRKRTSSQTSKLQLINKRKNETSSPAAAASQKSPSDSFAMEEDMNMKDEEDVSQESDDEPLSMRLQRNTTSSFLITDERSAKPIRSNHIAGRTPDGKRKGRGELNAANDETPVSSSSQKRRRIDCKPPTHRKRQTHDIPSDEGRSGSQFATPNFHCLVCVVEVCNESFSRSSSLKDHLLEAHAYTRQECYDVIYLLRQGETPATPRRVLPRDYVCTVHPCDRTYTSSSALRQHLSGVHKFSRQDCEDALEQVRLSRSRRSSSKLTSLEEREAKVNHTSPSLSRRFSSIFPLPDPTLFGTPVDFNLAAHPGFEFCVQSTYSEHATVSGPTRQWNANGTRYDSDADHQPINTETESDLSNLERVTLPDQSTSMDEEKTLVAPEDQNEDVARNVPSPTSPDAGDPAPNEFVPEAEAHQNLTPEDTSRTRESELLAPKHNVPSPPPLTAKGDVSNPTCDTALEGSVTKGSIGRAVSRAKSFLTEEDDPVAQPETSAASSSTPPLTAKEDTRDAAVEDSILASGRPVRRAALRARSLLKEEDERVAQAPSKKIVETSAASPSSPSLTAAKGDSIKHTCNTAPENSTERPTRRIASCAKSNLEEEEEPVARAPSRKIVKTSAAPSTTLVHDVDTVGMQVQNGSCQSSRYKHFEKCQSCISKNGQPCRFYDLRAFYTDEQGCPIGEPSFLAHKSNDDWAVVPAPGEFPSLSSSARYSLLFSHKEFQDNVKHELTHIQAKNAPPHRVRAPIPNTRQMCDFCEQGIYNTYYICKQCGKDLCLLCVEEGWRSHKAQEFTTIPEVHKCTYKRTHGMQNFLILSRWNVKQMENACSWVEGWVKQHGPSVQQEVATGERSLAAAMDLMMDIDDSSRKAPPAIDNTPALNSPVTSEDFQIDNLLNAPHPDLVIVPYKDLTLSLFQKCWRERKVVFVTQMDDRVDDGWSPTAFSAAAGDDLATIVNCVTGELQHESPLGPFFEGFGKRNTGAPRPNLKLKDWPTDMHFRHKLPEICGKFLDLIPVPEYTHPTGTFNLAGQIPDEDVPPDLGPKMYAAYGYEPEETGATTKLHLDVADAANVMVWSKPHWTPPSTSSPDGTTPIPPPSPPGSRRDGAIWDLFPPSSISALRNYLRTEYTPAYSHIADPIHDQMFYLQPHHLHAVATRHEITPIRLHQRVGDTVFIPAGFAHQVANYGDCIKCALDFVSPEGLPVCEHLCHEFRRLPRGHGRRGDTVCVGKIVWSVVKAAMAESGPQ